MQPGALPTVLVSIIETQTPDTVFLELFLFRKSKGSKLPVIFASIFLLRKAVSVSLLSPGEAGIMLLLSALMALWSRKAHTSFTGRKQ